MKDQRLVSNYIVYGSNNLELTPNFVHFERIEKSRLKNRGEIGPHVHSNIFQIIYISQGSIEFSSNDEKLTLGAGAMITIPENTIHELRFNQETKGAVITISQLLFYSLFSFNHEVPNSFSDIHIVYTEHQRRYLELLTQKLEKQLIAMLEPHEVTVRATLRLIISELYQSINTESLDTHKQLKVVDSYFTRFVRLIRQRAGTEKQLQYYAHELGITTTHLNRICKQTIGKTASGVIQDYIILEAKRYLSFTSHSISEIAYILEFSTPSYFNRYFKKSEGLTPRAYRLSLEKSL